VSTGDGESTEADSESETRDCSHCISCVADAEQEHCLETKTWHITQHTRLRGLLLKRLCIFGPKGAIQIRYIIIIIKRLTLR